MIYTYMYEHMVHICICILKKGFSVHWEVQQSRVANPGQETSFQENSTTIFSRANKMPLRSVLNSWIACCKFSPQWQCSLIKYIQWCFSKYQNVNLNNWNTFCPVNIFCVLLAWMKTKSYYNATDLLFQDWVLSWERVCICPSHIQWCDTRIGSC